MLDGVDVLERDVHVQAAAGVEIAPDHRADVIAVEAAADHLGRVRAIADHVVRADLLGAPGDVRNRRNGDTAEVRDRPQHVDLPRQVLAASVGRQAERREDRPLVPEQELLVHFRRDKGEFLGGRIAPELAALDAVDVRGGVGQLARVRHGLVLVCGQAPVPGGLRLLVRRQHAVAHEAHQLVQPVGVVGHVEHEVLDAAEIAQVGGEVGGPHSIRRRAVDVDRQYITDGLSQPVGVSGGGLFVDLMAGGAELPHVVELGDRVFGLPRAARLSRPVPPALQAPTGAPVRRPHGDPRLEGRVVAERIPVDLLPEGPLVVPVEVVFALPPRDGGDLVPRVAASHVEQRPGGLEAVLPPPELPPDGLHRLVADAHVPLCELSEDSDIP